MIQVRNVSKDIRVRLEESLGVLYSSVSVVTNVSLDIPQQVVLSLVGFPGCGNYTLAKMIARQVRPDSGYITFEGQKIDQIDCESWSRIARSFHPSVNRRSWGSGDELKSELTKIVEANPRIVVCSDTISAHDQETVFRLITEAHITSNSAFLVPTDSLDLAMRYAEITAVMWMGTILELGRSSKVERYPLSPFTKAMSTVEHYSADSNDRSSWERALAQCVANAAHFKVKGCRYHPVCPFAKLICIEKEPVLSQVEDEHWVSCHI